MKFWATAALAALVFAESAAAAAVVEELVVLVHRAAAHGIQVNRRTHELRELPQFLARIAPVNRRAGHDQRALGVAKDLRRLADDLRVGVDSSLRPV